MVYRSSRHRPFLRVVCSINRKPSERISMQLNPASLARTRCFLLAVCLVLLNALRIQGAGPPANDQCGTAELIPANGPFPYLTASTDMRQATTNGDPVLRCAIEASHSIWYTFTPSTSALYTFSTG